jgi:hypothetical protein
MTTRIRWIDKWSAAATDEWEAAEIEILVGAERRFYCPFISRVDDPEGPRWLYSIDVPSGGGGGARSVANGLTNTRTKAKRAAEQAIRRLATGPKIAT